MVRRKDMQHSRVLLETDTSGKSVMISPTGMEYPDRLMEEYITENTNRVIEMVKDIRGGQVAMNIGESSRITSNGEKESNKKREYSTETHMKKASVSAGVK